MQVDAQLSGQSPGLSVEGNAGAFSPLNSRSSSRGKDKLPPLLGTRGNRIAGSPTHPSSPTAPLRSQSPLATAPGLKGLSPSSSQLDMHRQLSSTPPPGSPSKFARSQLLLPSILDDNDEAMLNELLP